MFLQNWVKNGQKFNKSSEWKMNKNVNLSSFKAKIGQGRMQLTNFKVKIGQFYDIFNF